MKYINYKNHIYRLDDDFKYRETDFRNTIDPTNTHNKKRAEASVKKCVNTFVSIFKQNPDYLKCKYTWKQTEENASGIIKFIVFFKIPTPLSYIKHVIKRSGYFHYNGIIYARGKEWEVEGETAYKQIDFMVYVR